MALSPLQACKHDNGPKLFLFLLFQAKMPALVSIKKLSYVLCCLIHPDITHEFRLDNTVPPVLTYSLNGRSITLRNL